MMGPCCGTLDVGQWHSLHTCLASPLAGGAASPVAFPSSWLWLCLGKVAAMR